MASGPEAALPTGEAAEARESPAVAEEALAELESEVAVPELADGAAQERAARQVREATPADREASADTAELEAAPAPRARVVRPTRASRPAESTEAGPTGYRCGCGGPGPGTCTCHKECSSDTDCTAPNTMCGCSSSEPAPGSA